MNVINTWWSLVPALVAIVLALITKEVYSSLFIGIIVGGVLFCGFNIAAIMEHVFVDGMIGSIADPWNVGILIFLVVLGCIVALMNRAGGSSAFGKWAAKHVKTRVGAQLATIALGCIIFIDDYFNCLTVSSVMKPVTDKHKISREKLAYLIDATAAPICIIAPISSWAAAVASSVDGMNGFSLFIKAIPFNYYALLTIGMTVMLSIMNFDYGPMKKAEAIIKDKKDVDTVLDINESKGKVIHLILPIIVLIVSCVIGMVYTGGFFEGVSFREAIANCDASVGLVFGSSVSLIFTVVFYVLTRVIPFRECMESIPEGFKSMVPAILILSFAWALKAMTNALGSDVYVAGVVNGFAENNTIMSLLPAIIFIIGCIISFATGTSWGTFGILIPIVVKVFNFDTGNTLMIISVAACLAGSVCGDHCSPISDTTIMSSAGSQCKHMDHVTTQLPYALTCAAITLVSFIFAGFVRNAILCLLFGFILEVITLLIIKRVTSK